MNYRRIARSLIAGTLLVCLAGFTLAEEAPAPVSMLAVAKHAGEATVKARLVAHPDDRSAAIRVGVLFEIEPGWHIYWKNSGESGLPTRVDFHIPHGRVQLTSWPGPAKFEEPAPEREAPPLITYGYEDRVLVHAAVVPEQPGRQLSKVAAEVDLVACREACVPARFRLAGKVEELRKKSPDEVRAWFSESVSQIPVAPAVAGYELEPYLSHSAVRPGDHFELGFALRSRGRHLTIGDAKGVTLFPEVVDDMHFATPRVSRHPSESGALWIALPAEAEAEAQFAGQGSRVFSGVLRVGDGSRRAVVVSLPIPLAESGAEIAAQPLPWYTEPASDGQGLLSGWAGALLLGWIGGLVLNLMPCVLPILALKSFAVVEIAHRGRRAALEQGVSYTAGVLASMMLLAGVVVALRSAGTAVGWGFQLQEPFFLVGISSVVVLFAMNLFGAFEISTPAAVAGLGGKTVGSGRSFFEGFLAVALATPCSAPFLGTAVGFAFAASNVEIFAVLSAVGLGLASPFLVISAAPSLQRFLPRSGPWMLQMRMVLGFSLLATVLWLLWVLSRVAGSDAAAGASAWYLLLALCAWIYGQSQFSQRAWLKPVLVATLAGLLVAGPGVIRLDSSAIGSTGATETQQTRNYDAAEVSGTLAAGRPAFVFFTADWCITCKVNERRVLQDEAVRSELRARDVAVFRADLTQRNSELLAVLQRYGRAGVPLYLLFDPARPEDPFVLPDMLTKDLFLDRVYAAIGTQPNHL